MFKRLIGMGTIICLLIIAAAGTYIAVTYLFSAGTKPVASILTYFDRSAEQDDTLIKAGTIVRIEKKYKCGDIMTEFQGPATDDLIGLSESKIRELYPEDAGWEIQQLSGGIIKLTQNVSRLCDLHAQYRHLGIYQDMLAVYQGPLGFNENLIRVEKNISVDSLPRDFQAQLQQAMDFDRQDPSTKLQLRKRFEFANEQLLNSTLDSLDEIN